MDRARVDKPKEIYQWIQIQLSLVMLLDRDTQSPTSDITTMDEILHCSWDKVMRKYVTTPEPQLEVFLAEYSHFPQSGGWMQSNPIIGLRVFG